MIKNILLISLGLVPSLLWLWYFRLRDFRPEPQKTVFLFFLRGVVSAFVALLFQWISIKYFKIEDRKYYVIGLPLVYVISGALIEEVVKFGLFRVRLFKVKAFDEPVDAVIYMVTVAVGFAAVENVAIFLRTQNTNQLISLFLMRFISATLLHAVAGAVIGYFFVLQYTRKKYKKKKTNWFEKFVGNWLFLWGFALAVVLHTIYNLIIHYSVLNSDAGNSLWLMAGLLLISVFVTSHLTVRLNKLKLVK